MTIWAFIFIAAELEAELLALKASHERDLETAASSARRSAAAEVQAKQDRANEIFCRMMKKPIGKMVLLSQADSNLQLFDDLENAEEPFDPIAECALLVENKATLGSAYDVFDEMSDELRKILGMNYVVSINVADIVVSPRVETIAKSVGISVASGSNDGSLGMRLRSASEEISDSESGEMDKTVDPDQAVVTESQREPSPL